ncbi:MAG: hypothetical protein ACOC7U_10405, partial [Spirochaetota bacterium]
MTTFKKCIGLVGAGAILALFAVSCSSITDAVIGGAASGVGRSASERTEQAVYKKTAPKEQLPPSSSPQWNQYMANQAQVVFSYTFSPGGYWLGQKDYQ